MGKKYALFPSQAINALKYKLRTAYTRSNRMANINLNINSSKNMAKVHR